MMDQEMDLAQAYGYDESVWSVLGPMGPIATYHRPLQLSQTIPSGQSHSSHAQVSQTSMTSTPNRGPPRRGNSSGSSKSSAKTDSLETSTVRAKVSDHPPPSTGGPPGIEPGLKEALRAADLDFTRISWLFEEGFTTKRMIGAMSPEIMAELLQSKADSNPLPLGQKMAMQNLVKPTASVPQGYAAPLNPQMTFPPADHGMGWMGPRQLTRAV